MDVLKIIMISFKAWPSWLSSCGYFQRGERSFKCELGYTSTSSVLRERRALFAWNFAILYLWLNTPPLLLWWYIPLSVNSHCVIPLICVTVWLSHEGNDVTKQSVSFCQTKKRTEEPEKRTIRIQSWLLPACAHCRELKYLKSKDVIQQNARHCVLYVWRHCVFVRVTRDVTLHCRHYECGPLQLSLTDLLFQRTWRSSRQCRTNDINSPMPDYKLANKQCEKWMWISCIVCYQRP